MRSNLSFKSNNLKLAGHLYVPDDYKKGEKRPAIVVSHHLVELKNRLRVFMQRSYPKKASSHSPLMRVIRVKAKESHNFLKIHLRE
jgi:hypothetical protein